MKNGEYRPDIHHLVFRICFLLMLKLLLAIIAYSYTLSAAKIIS